MPDLAALALLAVATFVSEDLTCIAAGGLVASGELGFAPATAACFAGIFAGDLLLFAAGRSFGRAALARAPLRRWLDEPALARGAAWLERNGPTVILLSRFAPGTRLPTYVAAGALRTRTATFALYFGLACALWTPALVGLSALWSDAVRALLGGHRVLLALAALALVAALRIATSATTHRGRRLLLSRWRRADPLGVLAALALLRADRRLDRLARAATPKSVAGDRGEPGHSRRRLRRRAQEPDPARLPRRGRVPARERAPARDRIAQSSAPPARARSPSAPASRWC